MAKSIRTNIIWLGLVLFHLSVSYMIALTRGFRWVGFLIPGAAWLFFCWCWYRSEVDFANNNGDSPALYDARGKRGMICLAGLLGLILLLLFIPGQTEEAVQMISMYMVELSFACWICSWAGFPMHLYCGIRKPRFIPALFLLLPAAFMMYLISSFVNILSLIFFAPQIGDDIIQSVGGLPAAFLALALLPALVEEIFFRGLIFRSLSGKWKPILISALCFALLHMNFNQMAYAFVMGIPLGWTVWKTGNLLCSMILHMSFNSITVLTVYLGSRGGSLQSSSQNDGMTDFLLDKSGSLMWQPLVFGLIASLICLAFFVGLICLYCRMNPSGKPVADHSLSVAEDGGSVGTAPMWKPDVMFVLGCLICLLYAFLIEMV